MNEDSSYKRDYYASELLVELFTICMKKHIPVGTCRDPEARFDAAVIALKTEHVQFHIPLFPKADWEVLNSSKHSKNWSTLHVNICTRY